MKLVFIAGMGSLLLFLLLGFIFSRPRKRKGEVPLLEKRRVPWAYISVLRLVRLALGICALAVGLMCLKRLGVVLDTQSTKSGGGIALSIFFLLTPSFLLCWAIGAIRSKVNVLYQEGARSSALLIARCWSF